MEPESAEITAEHLTPPPLPQGPAFNKRDLTIGLVSLAIGLIVGVGGTLTASSFGGGTGSFLASTAIVDATQTCDVIDNVWIAVGDEGQSISMQSEGKESPGAEYVDVLCVLDQLDVPDSVNTRIGSTRALDGRQTATWADFDASWGYHPDSGLDIVVELSQQ
ncbi:hypothetical protein E3O45_03785 [Cryobacterium sp. TMS1-20-1]|uniref:hypothetical protein n=1 Tax=Cryobacterium sp. TMS1-20-1 TaxID=1259223 RepID=UPI001068FD76|nr:hypothetical protein [Cryobacterium sp. TMS1-20-1]TFC79409.1 hypothetical protein E3O45_03785 [Cryobacterium sp. TMS1-20-1]